MIKSMTGYGQGEFSESEKKIVVEIKSVNHKYMDTSIKMPRRLIKFENNIRTLLKEYATRGKIDIFITFEDDSEGSAKLKYDPSLAKEYYNYYKQICSELEIEEDIRVSSIARSPEVITIEENEMDDDEIWHILEGACKKAFEHFESARIKEGKLLQDDITSKLDEILEVVDHIEKRLPDIINEYKAKLEERLNTFIEDKSVDEGRIAAELVIYSDKIAVDEELVRLRTHIVHMKDVLADGGEKGRNLDFLAQEMNRESNTILSKSNDIDVTNKGIELKTCIEKIREQVQNIE